MLNSQYPSATQKIRILHLEDDPSDAELIHRALTKSGIIFETRLIHTPEEFDSALVEFRPDIILSDHSLPAFNSLEALNILKRSELQVPFILLTGEVSEKFAALALKQGIDDYILKDRMERLPSAILSALEKYQLKKDQRRAAEQLQKFSEYSKDVLCILDEDGTFRYVSNASVYLWGYLPEEMTGKNYIDFICMEDIEATARVAQSSKDGVAKNFENRYVRKDGALVHIQWSFNWESTEKTFFCVAKDVSEQFDAQQKDQADKALY